MISAALLVCTVMAGTQGVQCPPGDFSLENMDKCVVMRDRLNSERSGLVYKCFPKVIFLPPANETR